MFLNPLFVFVGAVVLVLAFNLWACGWIDREWDRWTAGQRGQKIETKLAKMRTGRFMHHPVRWVTSGSSWLFAVGATIINPALVTVVARMLGGQRVGERRILVASLTYAVVESLLWTAVGFGAGEGAFAVT
jgi:urease accessory protein UreF